MNWTALLIGAGAACALALAVVGLWIRISRRLAIVDRPTARSSHTRVTPRGGGVGIVVSTLAGVALVQLLNGAGDATAAAWAGGLALAVAGVSLVDDVRSLPSLVRLIVHLGVAALAVRVLGAFGPGSLPALLSGELLPPLLFSAVTVVWIVGLTNVYNFMDGIDGIAGCQGVVAGLAWAWYGTHTGVAIVSAGGLAVAAACAGFLVYNWAPARVFMGDVGSAFLGFVFAVLPLLAGHDGARALAAEGVLAPFALFAVWPFVADGLFTFVRRVRYREDLLTAHRSHLYQRLTIAGWGHAAVTRLYAGWAVACGLLGIAYVLGGPLARLLAMGGAVATLMGIYFVVNRAEGTLKKR